MITRLSRSMKGGVFDVTAVVLTYFAVVSLPAVTTNALVHADFVDAGAAVAAWVTLTVVDV